MLFFKKIKNFENLSLSISEINQHLRLDISDFIIWRDKDNINNYSFQNYFTQEIVKNSDRFIIEVGNTNDNNVTLNFNNTTAYPLTFLSNEQIPSGFLTPYNYYVVFFVEHNSHFVLTNQYTEEEKEFFYIVELIKNVQDFASNYIGKDLLTTQYQLFLNQFPCCSSSGILIKKSPLQSVQQITYLNTNNELIVWSADNYYINFDNWYSSIKLEDPHKRYPDDVNKKCQSIIIDFTTGYGDSFSSIPYNIKLGMLHHLAYLYESRGDCGADTACMECNGLSVPKTSVDLYNTLKIMVNFTENEEICKC